MMSDISKHFVKSHRLSSKATCSLTLADAMCIFLSRRDLLCQKKQNHDQLTICFVLLKLKI